MEKPVAITDSFAVQNFIKAFFPELEETVQVYPSAQKVFGELVKERYAGQKVKTVYLTDVREFGGESGDQADVTLLSTPVRYIGSSCAPAARRPESIPRRWMCLVKFNPAVMMSSSRMRAGIWRRKRGGGRHAHRGRHRLFRCHCLPTWARPDSCWRRSKTATVRLISFV